MDLNTGKVATSKCRVCIFAFASAVAREYVPKTFSKSISVHAFCGRTLPRLLEDNQSAAYSASFLYAVCIVTTSPEGSCIHPEVAGLPMIPHAGADKEPATTPERDGSQNASTSASAMQSSQQGTLVQRMLKDAPEW